MPEGFLVLAVICLLLLDSSTFLRPFFLVVHAAGSAEDLWTENDAH